jgi:hypothetical protein
MRIESWKPTVPPESLILCVGAAALFTALKIQHVIDLSWWVALLPVWGPAVVLMVWMAVIGALEEQEAHRRFIEKERQRGIRFGDQDHK